MFPKEHPWIGTAIPTNPIIPPQVSKVEFDQLKKEVQNMKELLEKAIKYDEANNEPHYEIEEKMEFLRAIAKLVDIDLDDVIGNPGSGGKPRKKRDPIFPGTG